jgi:prepilin-type processing-associated H-X9-DG protein
MANHRRPRNRETLVVSILLCVGVLALIISVVLPYLNYVKARRGRVPCSSNLRQIGQGVAMYANDYRNAYPSDLAALVKHADLHPGILVCPDTKDTPAKTAEQVYSGGHLSYVYIPLKGPSEPGDAVMAYEPLANHGNGSYVLFNDGRVEWIEKHTAAKAIAELQKGLNPPPSLAVNARSPTTAPATMKTGQ